MNLATLENDDSAVAVGKRLKRLRLMAALSRGGLAEEAEVGVTSISLWENAKTDANPMKPRNATKLISAIRRMGVECNEQWLLSGAGLPPRIVHEPSTKGLLSIESGKEQVSTSALVSILDSELKLFSSFSELAVITRVENSCLSPAFEKGDIVGGIWQSANSLSAEKICIVVINEKLQIRRVKKGSQEGLFHVSYIVYDSAESEPFELKDYSLEKIAPIIRLWRC